MGYPGLDGEDGEEGFPGPPGPAGTGGGGSGIALWDADADTGIQVEETADEDKIRFDIAGTERMNLSATGLHLPVVGVTSAIDFGGDVNLYRSAADVLKTDDSLLVMGTAGFGNSGSILAYRVLNVSHAWASGTDTAMRALSALAYYQHTTANVNVYGIYAAANYEATAGNATSLYGIYASSYYASAQNVTTLYGCNAFLSSTTDGVGTITTAYALRSTALWSGSKPATAYGVRVEAAIAPAGVVTGYGLSIPDLAATTAYLVELGPATPYFRIVGGAAPGANLTNVYVNEGGTLRRVQWKNPDATGHMAAADKVLVLV